MIVGTRADAVKIWDYGSQSGLCIKEKSCLRKQNKQTEKDASILHKVAPFLQAIFCP